MRATEGVEFMTKTHRAAVMIVGWLALFAALATPLGAQVAKLIDPNEATESELQPLPSMTPDIVKNMVAKRPFKTVAELQKFLLEQNLKPEQTREFYRRAFIPINLNSATREEFLLIPGVGSRMANELMEYRPWKTWGQFDKEIGKYVGQLETDRLKRYVFIPPS
jgi:DNA uptake protein ComE-like DNA-binding protein